MELDRKLFNEGLALIELSRIGSRNLVSEGILVYGAIMKATFYEPGHYMAYVGIGGIESRFHGLTDLKADSLAREVSSGQKDNRYYSLPHGISYSEESLFSGENLATWWIGTDFGSRKSSTLKQAEQACWDLFVIFCQSESDY